MQLSHVFRTGRTRVVTAVIATAGAAVLALPAAAPAAVHRAEAAPAVDASQQAAVDHLVREQGLPAAEAARRIAAQPAQEALATRLTRELGARSAGTFLDQATGDLVVNVLDSAAASRVTTAGARAKVVGNATSRLDAVKAELDRGTAVPNTSWAVDVTTNTVVVQVPAAAQDAAFLAKLKSYGPLVRVERVGGTLSTHAFYGGQAILGGSSRCSSAFNAQTSGGVRYVITAGHCTRAISSWRTSGGLAIGTSAVARFPSDDYGTIRVSNPTALDQRGAVIHNGAPRTITGNSQVPVGSAVCKTGSTTGTTCGTVQAYNVTVNYAEGAVFGMIRTNVCTQPGDSGGALYAGSLAQGIVSGGTVGGCNTSGFRSFFQPVGEVLSTLGLRLL